VKADMPDGHGLSGRASRETSPVSPLGNVAGLSIARPLDLSGAFAGVEAKAVYQAVVGVSR
jgi:hypothetical protein